MAATCGTLLVALAVVAVAATAIGPVTIPFLDTAGIVAGSVGLELGVYDPRDVLVVQEVRLPRVIVGALVGAALGISGAAMQGVFRNPLAEPGVIGVSSGAAIGAVAALYFGWTALSRWVLPAAAFLGAMAAMAVVFAVASMTRARSTASLLLVGIAISALLGSLISVMVATAPTDDDLRSIVFWLQGGLEARTWAHVQLIVVPLLLGALLLVAFGRDLNVLLLGEEEARSSGVHVARVRLALLALASLLTGVGVAVSGVIAFVGLVVPHAVRLAVGPDHRVLLPASVLGGAAFLVLADLGARMLFSPVTLQVGVVTALVGAPAFLLLVLRSRQQGIG
ncbi:MAG TPA: iron ABC transporter permease [Pseudonocardia sp.]|nr:iron ABC transporter permease [Pseudonocardia sp.]